MNLKCSLRLGSSTGSPSPATNTVIMCDLRPLAWGERSHIILLCTRRMENMGMRLVCTEAESSHHITCSDFTFTDHFSHFMFMFHLHVPSLHFKFTFMFIVRDSLRARLSGDACTTVPHPHTVCNMAVWASNG